MLTQKQVEIVRKAVASVFGTTSVPVQFDGEFITVDQWAIGKKQVTVNSLDWSVNVPGFALYFGEDEISDDLSFANTVQKLITDMAKSAADAVLEELATDDLVAQFDSGSTAG